MNLEVDETQHQMRMMEMVPLSAEDTDPRLQWTVEGWENVAWSDECGLLLRLQMVGSEYGTNPVSKTPGC